MLQMDEDDTVSRACFNEDPAFSDRVSVEGMWTKGKVVGKRFTSKDGREGTWTETSYRRFKLMWQGEHFEGELGADRKLYWSDGDIWDREDESFESPPTSMPDLDKDSQDMDIHRDSFVEGAFFEYSPARSMQHCIGCGGDTLQAEASLNAGETHVKGTAASGEIAPSTLSASGILTDFRHVSGLEANEEDAECPDSTFVEDAFSAVSPQHRRRPTWSTGRPTTVIEGALTQLNADLTKLEVALNMSVRWATKPWCEASSESKATLRDKILEMQGNVVERSNFLTEQDEESDSTLPCIEAKIKDSEFDRGAKLSQVEKRLNALEDIVDATDSGKAVVPKPARDLACNVWKDTYAWLCTNPPTIAFDEKLQMLDKIGNSISRQIQKR
jgi:hypothetical protein